jgi:hypothetical protein
LVGDNLGVIHQSASILESDIKKKHVAISYHCVREAVAAGIVNPIWCATSENWSDICTKALGPSRVLCRIVDFCVDSTSARYIGVPCRCVNIRVVLGRP